LPGVAGEVLMREAVGKRVVGGNDAFGGASVVGVSAR
jgi:hypothetical protein